MPVRKRKDLRRAEVTDEHIAWLNGDDKASGFVKYSPREELAALWITHSERIVAEHVAANPGTRPTRWWQFDSPRIPLGTYPGAWFDGQLPEPRKRLAGTGTPIWEALLAYKPIYQDGLPAIWVEKWMVKYYGGTAVNIRGEPIGSLVPTNFKGVAIDPNDPPLYEAQATYLKRLGLFLVGEERRVKRADWEAVVHPVGLDTPCGGEESPCRLYQQGKHGDSRRFDLSIRRLNLQA